MSIELLLLICLLIILVYELRILRPVQIFLGLVLSLTLWPLYFSWIFCKDVYDKLFKDDDAN